MISNNTDISAPEFGGLDTSKSAMDRSTAKFVAWELSMTGASSTHETGISAAKGGRILNWAVGPVPDSDVIPSTSTGSFSLAIDTGIFTITGANGRAFNLYVWYR